TGSCGRSKATRKPARCSWARTVASARIPTGTLNRRASRNEVASRSVAHRYCDRHCVRGGRRLSTEPLVFFSARREPPELAESRTEEHAREVQQSAAAL